MHLAKTGWNKDADILHDMTTCLEGCQSSVRIDSLTLPTLICKRKRSSSVQGTIYHLQFIPNSFYKKKIIQRKIDSLLLQTRLWCNKIQNIILTSFLMPVEIDKLQIGEREKGRTQLHFNAHWFNKESNY